VVRWQSGLNQREAPSLTAQAIYPPLECGFIGRVLTEYTDPDNNHWLCWENGLWSGSRVRGREFVTPAVATPWEVCLRNTLSDLHLNVRSHPSMLHSRVLDRIAPLCSRRAALQVGEWVHWRDPPYGWTRLQTEELDATHPHRRGPLLAVVLSQQTEEAEQTTLQPEEVLDEKAEFEREIPESVMSDEKVAEQEANPMDSSRNQDLMDQNPDREQNVVDSSKEKCSSGKELAQQSALVCALSLQPLTDPVIAADGFTYERSAIEQYLRTGTPTITSSSTAASLTSLTSPVTGEPLYHRHLLCDLAAQSLLFSRSVLHSSLPSAPRVGTPDGDLTSKHSALESHGPKRKRETDLDAEMIKT